MFSRNRPNVKSDQTVDKFALKKPLISYNKLIFQVLDLKSTDFDVYTVWLE